MRCSIFQRVFNFSFLRMFKMHELLSYSFNTAIVPLTVEKIDLCSNVDFQSIFTICLRSFLLFFFLHSLEHFVTISVFNRALFCLSHNSSATFQQEITMHICVFKSCSTNKFIFVPFWLISCRLFVGVTSKIREAYIRRGGSITGGREQEKKELQIDRKKGRIDLFSRLGHSSHSASLPCSGSTGGPSSAQPGACSICLRVDGTGRGGVFGIPCIPATEHKCPGPGINQLFSNAERRLHSWSHITIQ